MKQTIKKCLSIFLSALILINYVPGNIFAEVYNHGPLLTAVGKEEEVLLKEMLLKSMLEQSNKARSDLAGEISAIDRRIKILQGYIEDGGFRTRGQVEEFKSILEDYRRFLINLEDSETILTKIQLKKFNTFDLLIGKYTEIPYSKIALEGYYKERISQIKYLSVKLSRNKGADGHKTLIRTPGEIDPNMLVNVSQKIKYNEQNIMLLDKALENLLADPNAPIRNMYAREINIIFTRLTETQGELDSELAQSLKMAEDVFEKLKNEASRLLDFSNTKSKANFFENLSRGIIDALEETEVGASDEFLKALFVRQEDTLKQATKKLQLLYTRLVDKVSKDASDSLSKMIRFLECLRTEEQFKEFMAANKRLTPTQKEIIKQMQEFAKREDIKYLLEIDGHIINGEYEKLYMEVLSKRAAGQAARRSSSLIFVSNVSSGLAMVLGSLLILYMIVNVNAGDNSFAQAIDPAILEGKIANGTANNMEKYAFYMHPFSSKYIDQNPLQFASVILPIAAGIKNPLYAEILNDPMINLSCGCGTDKAALELDKFLNDIEIPQSLDIELPQI